MELKTIHGSAFGKIFGTCHQGRLYEHDIREDHPVMADSEHEVGSHGAVTTSNSKS